MTLIHFQYTENYHTPAKGTVVFMPHRRHAANETEVLPKPFHKKLVSGEVTVDLEPTQPTWVWSVTHDDTTMFYTIPEHDGILEHTELIPIAPSTLPTANNAVEPAWWAEIRQYKSIMADVLNTVQRQHDESLDTLREYATDFNTALQDAARHESVAGAYSRQAQASNEQAWEASKGPDGAAQRAKDEADRAEIYRNEANKHRLDAQQHSQNAETHAENAGQQYQNILDYTQGWDSLDDAITEAEDAANRSSSSAEAAATARDEAVTARDGMIVGATLEDDHLMLETVNGTTINVGNIRGPQGEQGPQGEPGQDGVDGVAILESPNGTQYQITVDDDGALSTEPVD